MQPTYLPWSGYFGLMQSVDLFIFLDTVQFARRSWQQRNQIKGANGAQWLTIAVQTKGRRDQPIADVKIEPSANFAREHRRSIEHSYRKAPCFDAWAVEMLDCLQMPRASLCDLNIEMTLFLKEKLQITTPVMRSSEMRAEGEKAGLLAALCDQVGATEYISPPGSRGYLEESKAFEEQGIPVRYFSFEHPEYPQLFGSFLPYMSCIDMLLNCGNDSRSLINLASGTSS